MKYREAIELIRKIESRGVNFEEINLLTQANETILENYDKYRWHDLREDPFDVPELDEQLIYTSKDIIIVVKHNNGTVFEYAGYYDNQGKFFTYMHESCERWFVAGYGESIIAWKYMEQFEVEY